VIGVFMNGGESMRKLLGILFSAVLLLIGGPQGTWAQNAKLAGGGSAFLPGTIKHSGRTVIRDDIVHYRYDVVAGPGKFDVIRLHRVVKERVPHHPVRTVDGVLMLLGAPNSFEMIFAPPLISSVPAWDHSIAIFLAENNIDVWGMDYGWALVPAETTDFRFLKGWGVVKDSRHTEVALSVARQIRALTGQSAGPLHLLGFCYGAVVAYSVAGEETRWPHFLRNVKGIIPHGNGMKYNDPAVRALACSDIVQYKDMLKAGVYQLDTGIFAKSVGDLALTAPDGDSPYFPGLTNNQVVLLLGATPGPPPMFWHYVAGYLDPSGIPTGLRYTDPDLWRDVLRAAPPYLPVQAFYDNDAVQCDEVDVPFDDHLGQIAVPILHIGAIGEGGDFDSYTTTLTASKDVTDLLVQLEPDRTPESRMIDFGHVDVYTAANAETLVWRPLLDWLKAHR
jgi:hypothetical protein